MNPITEIINAAAVLKDWLGEGGDAVPVEMANRRSETCLHCPNHRGVHWWEHAKQSLAKSIAEQIVIKNQMGVRLEREQDMGICNACGCVLVLKCHVPLKHILAHTDENTMKAFDSKCWIRQEAPL